MTNESLRNDTPTARGSVVQGPPRLTYQGLYDVVGRIIPPGRVYSVEVKSTRLPCAGGARWRVETAWTVRVEGARGRGVEYVGQGWLAEEALEDLRSEMGLPRDEPGGLPGEDIGVGRVSE